MIVKSIIKNKRKTSSKIIFEDDLEYDLEDLLVVKYKLYEGMDISKVDFFKILDESQIEYGYNLAIKYLAKYVKSEEEIRRYLYSKKILKNNCERIILKLENNKLLNEEKTIDTIIFGLIISHNGINMIRHKLKLKGFDNNLIEEKLLNIDEESYKNALKETYNKALKQYDKYNDFEKKKKIWNYLYSKGYTQDDIEFVLHYKI